MDVIGMLTKAEKAAFEGIPVVEKRRWEKKPMFQDPLAFCGNPLLFPLELRKILTNTHGHVTLQKIL